jgi:P27 family predicted phage terminase small subunit
MKRAPAPPKHLTPAAAKAWKMFCAQIGEVKTSDHASLAVLATAWVRLQQADAKIEEEGAVIMHTNGVRGINPWVRAARDARTAVLQISKAFCLTPAARGQKTDDGMLDELPEY